MNGPGFQFILHLPQFHHSSKSNWAIFVDNSVTPMKTMGDHSNMLASKAIRKRFFQPAREYTFFPSNRCDAGEI